MDSNEGHNLNLYEGTAYTLTRNIMVTAIIVLCFILFLIISLHLYARWYLRRVRRRRHFVFYVDSVSAGIPPQGLDPSLLHSLPVFLYSSDTHPPSECAVCLSEFQDNESGRVLPQCNHAFHVDCIDMWFHSHSTCPLCRSRVETPQPESEVVVIDVCEPGSSSDRIEEEEPNKRTGRKLYSSKSWIGLRRKSSSTSVGASIEVPKTRSFGREIKASYN